MTLVDNVTLAMHVVLERLSPAERTSFLLHDVFQYPFEEIASIVGRSPAACRQLASRARRTLEAESATGRFPVDSALQQQVSERFIEACRGGDLEGLLALLDPAVDGAGDVVTGVVSGAAQVAPGILRYLGPPAAPTLLYLPVGDRVGIIAMRDHRVLALVLLTIDHGLVVHVDALTGPGPRAALSTALGLR
jgi:RNA polymerase sigma-70 factor (ECF subfamily)